jgi:hypothetical protein
MTTDPVRLAAKLADVERYLAVERRHVIAMTAQLDKARGLGWEDGMIRVEDLLELSEARIARLELEHVGLVIGGGS